MTTDRLAALLDVLREANNVIENNYGPDPTLVYDVKRWQKFQRAVNRANDLAAAGVTVAPQPAEPTIGPIQHSNSMCQKDGCTCWCQACERHNWRHERAPQPAEGFRLPGDPKPTRCEDHEDGYHLTHEAAEECSAETYGEQGFLDYENATPQPAPDALRAALEGRTA